jgi:hypothetical protein
MMFVPGGKVQVKPSVADHHLRRAPRVLTVRFVVGRMVHTDSGVYHYNDLEVGDRSSPPSRAQHPFGNAAWAKAKAKKK